MSISLRLRIILILAATVPLLLGGVWSLYTLHRTGALVIEQSEQALTEAGETSILKAADATARQIELYAGMHPEIDWTDTAELENDTTLAQIAVQPVGQTGYTAVFDEEGITHFHVNPAIVGMDMSTLAAELPEFWAIMEASLGGSPAAGYYDWEEAEGQIRAKYMSIVPVEGTGLLVAATTYIDEFSYPIVETKSELANTQTTARIQLILALLGVGALAAIGASHLGQQFTRPIRQLADAATRATAGDLSAPRLPERRDEIGALSRAFETMIAQLNNLITSLETRSAELSQRTEELEKSSQQYERRAAQLEASAQIAHAVAALLNPEQLLTQVVHLLSEAFGHYHTGVFLLDETGQWAELHAANSTGGQRMLERGHRLDVGARGIVGHVTQTGEPRVALNVGADVIYFDNPDLPDTRSEIALPLIARGQVIGVLDVQSTAENAFDEEDMTVLSSLANQIAVALDNARLYEASQKALAQVRAVQQQYVRDTWREYTAQSETDFYEYQLTPMAPVATRGPSTKAAGEEPLPETDEALNTDNTVVSAGDDGQTATIVAPIKVRGQVIGTLGFEDTAAPDEDQGTGRVWSTDEIALIETVADQIGQAMEAARLLNDAQRRARQEQLVTEITSRIRSAPDIDGILRTAVQEIRQALGVSHGVIRLGTETHLRPPETREETPAATNEALPPEDGHLDEPAASGKEPETREGDD